MQNFSPAEPPPAESPSTESLPKKSPAKKSPAKKSPAKKSLQEESSLQKTSPFVSVIIPVYNDAERLKEVLERLAAQTYARYEVIVVDNGSTCLADVQKLVEGYPFVALTIESTPGSYAARNRGIAQAKGEVLAFTDADCLPAPDWLEQGVRQLQAHPDCGLVAGAIRIVTEDANHPVELYERLMGLSQQKFVEQDHFGATANIFTRPAIFERVGLFNSTLKSSGDVEWGQRVYAQGYLPVYAASARVDHPARRSFSQLSRQASRHAGGFYDLHCRQNPTFIGRNVAYCKLVGFHLLPPVMFAWSMAHHPDIKTLGQAVKVVLVLAFVRLVTVRSLLQLKFGGMSERE
jgi:glycosyltransferase involved in cell wall biosynthesis